MKKLFTTLWAKFIIYQITRSVIKNEFVLRVLIHSLLLELKNRNSEQFELEYEAPGVTDLKLIMIAYLTDKK